MTTLPPSVPDLSSDERHAARERLCQALDSDLAERPVTGARVRDVLRDPPVRAVVDDPLNHRGDTALHQAVRQSRGLPVLRALLEAGADPNLRDLFGQGRPALLLCLDEVIPTVHLEWLLAHGADPNVTGPTGDGALGRLMASGDTPDRTILLQLLNAGANCHLANRRGTTPMMLAIDDGLDWVVEAFVEHEARQLHAAGATPSDAVPDRPSTGRARL